MRQRSVHMGRILCVFSGLFFLDLNLKIIWFSMPLCIPGWTFHLSGMIFISLFHMIFGNAHTAVFGGIYLWSEKKIRITPKIPFTISQQQICCPRTHSMKLFSNCQNINEQFSKLFFNVLCLVSISHITRTAQPILVVSADENLCIFSVRISRCFVFQ